MRLQDRHLDYVIEFDIKVFFDNVNHEKLIRQMWTLGIRDKLRNNFAATGKYRPERICPVRRK